MLGLLIWLVVGKWLFSAGPADGSQDERAQPRKRAATPAAPPVPPDVELVARYALSTVGITVILIGPAIVTVSDEPASRRSTRRQRKPCLQF